MAIQQVVTDTSKYKLREGKFNFICVRGLESTKSPNPLLGSRYTMRKPIKIGEHVFPYKKDAISYYRTILNSYDFGVSLSDEHFSDLLDLLYWEECDEVTGQEAEDIIVVEDLPYISDIKINQSVH